MKIARVQVEGRTYRAHIEGTTVRLLQTRNNGETADYSLLQISDVRLLAPVRPSKILAVLGGFPTIFGLTRDEARSQGRRLGFTAKLPTALVGNGDPIAIPSDAPYPVVAEAELGVVIGRRCTKVTPQQAAKRIAGYVCVNDVCMLALGRADHDFMRCKSFDTFCPLGPWIDADVTESEIAAGLSMRGLVDGEVLQTGCTADYTYLPSEVVSQASQYFTLLPGDVISMGSPPNQPPIHPGQTVSVEIESIGALTNPVVSGPPNGVEAIHWAPSTASA